MLGTAGWGPDDPEHGRAATQRRFDNRSRQRPVRWEPRGAAAVAPAAGTGVALPRGGAGVAEGVPGLIVWYWADDSAPPLHVQDKYVKFPDAVCQQLEAGFQANATRIDVGGGRHVSMRDKDAMLQVR